jgi:hypothetical protein
MRLLPVLVAVAAAALAGGSATAANRGIPHFLGDKDTTSLTGTGDVDSFTTGLPRGAALSATVKAAKNSSLLPALSLVRPDGTEVTLLELTAAKYKPGKASCKFSNFPIDQTGTWAIKVSEHVAHNGGTYTLSTKVKYPKPIKVKGAVLPSGGFLEIEVPLANTVKLAFALKRKSGGTGFTAPTLRQGSGASVAFPASLFTITEKGIGLKAVEVTTPSFSNHVLKVPGPSTGGDAIVDYQVKTTWPKRKGIARTISSLEPSITGASPIEGNLGTTIQVTGFGFASGATFEVGDKPATAVTRNPAGTLMTGLAPTGTGYADIAITNPDGQEARLTDAFLFVVPPTVTSIDVDFGPSTGGTDVVITGANYRPGAIVYFGGTPIYGAVDIQSSSTIALTTESHGAGTVVVSVVDPSGVSGASATTFTFDRRLVLRPDLVSDHAATARPAAALLGDLDGDFLGADDLIVSSPEAEPDGSGGFLPATRIFRGNNNLGFTTFTLNSFPKPFFPTANAFATALGITINPPREDYGIAHASVMGDLDDDGDQDLVLGFNGHFIPSNSWVLVNPNYPATSSYQFIPSPNYMPDQQYYYIHYPGTRVLLNDGNNVFINTTMSFSTAGGLDLAMPISTQGIIDGEVFAARALALGDLDNDGDLDLALATYDRVNAVQLLFSGGTYSVTHIVTPALRFLANDGAGKFAFQSSLFISGWSPPAAGGESFQSSALAIGDVDNNGYRDVVAVNDIAPLTGGGAKMYAVRLLLNSGTALVPTPANLPSATNVDDGRATCVLLTDVTGDGKADIVISTPDPLVYFDAGNNTTTTKSSTRILKNNGTGTFTDVTATAIPLPTNAEPWRADSVAFGDVNADGKADLVLALDAVLPDGSGGFKPSTRVLLGNGAGVFTPAPAVLVPAVDLDAVKPSFLQGKCVMLGDLDGDGDRDIVLASRIPASGIPEPESQAPGVGIIENR